MQFRKSKKQPLKLSYDNIIVGSSLEAVLFAHQTQTPLICTRFLRPYYFETIEEFGLGSDKLDIWNKYMFILSMGGLVPFVDKIKLLRYIDSNTLKVVCQEETIVTVTYNRLFLFDDYHFYDLPVEPIKTSRNNMIVDWMKVHSGRHHEIDYYDRDNHFMKRVLFHKSGRPKKNLHKKDCIAISYLSDKQLESEKYAEYVVRIKTEKLMEEIGIQKNHQADIAVEHLRRDKIPIDYNVYEDFDNVIFMDCEPRSAWEFGNPRSKITYLRYIKAKLGL